MSSPTPRPDGDPEQIRAERDDYRRRLAEADRQLARNLEHWRNALVERDELRAEVASLTEDLATARAEAIKRVTDVDRQWCENIDKATGSNLADAAVMVISQLRDELDAAAASRRVVEAARAYCDEYRFIYNVDRDNLDAMPRLADTTRFKLFVAVDALDPETFTAVESLPAQHGEETWMCGAFQRASYRAGYRCTEPSEHAGPHRAVLDGAVLAEWTGPNNGEETSNG